MVQLATFLWGAVLLFALVGFLRGSTQEMIALTGIVLALFALEQLRGLMLTSMVARATLEQQFYIYAGILVAVTLAAYQVPEGFGTKKDKKGQGLQESLLGAFIGGLNAYLLFGSMWYYMDNFHYPLYPDIWPPPGTSASAELVNHLPLVWLLEGNLLTLAVIILFLFLIIVVI